MKKTETMPQQEERNWFARRVSRIMREQRITEKEFVRRLSWSLDEVKRLLKGEKALDRRIKVKVAQALGLKPESPEARGPGLSTGFEALTDEKLDSLFEMDIPDSYKY